MEPTANIGRGYMMTAMLDPLPDATHRHGRTGEPEIMKFDFVVEFPRTLKQADVGFAAESALHCEGLSLFKTGIDFIQKNAPGLDRAGWRTERREAAGDFIDIKEAQALYFLGQELAGKGRFARTVAAGDEVDGGCLSGHGGNRYGEVL